MKMELTPALVRAAAQDAGTRSMQKAGRTKWNRADYNAACAEFNRLAPSLLSQGSKANARF